MCICNQFVLLQKGQPQCASRRKEKMFWMWACKCQTHICLPSWLQSRPSVSVVMANSLETHYVSNLTLVRKQCFQSFPSFPLEGFCYCYCFSKKRTVSCTDLAYRPQLSWSWSSQLWFAFVQVQKSSGLLHSPQNLNHPWCCKMKQPPSEVKKSILQVFRYF